MESEDNTFNPLPLQLLGQESKSLP